MRCRTAVYTIRAAWCDTKSEAAAVVVSGNDSPVGQSDGILYWQGDVG